MNQQSTATAIPDLCNELLLCILSWPSSIGPGWSQWMLWPGLLGHLLRPWPELLVLLGLAGFLCSYYDVSKAVSILLLIRAHHPLKHLHTASTAYARIMV